MPGYVLVPVIPQSIPSRKDLAIHTTDDNEGQSVSPWLATDTAACPGNKDLHAK